MSETALFIDPQESAKTAGLRYVSDEDSGFCRKRWGRGFTYFDSDGKRVKNSKWRQRFESLVIPPAWENVWICRDPNGHIQATGYDDQGRKQYIYHPDWEKVRSEAKFDRLQFFGQALPEIRAQVDADLRRTSLSRQKVTALVVLLLEETLIRVGNTEYAATNKAYGLTTLRDRHLNINGTTLYFEFRGKRGIQHRITLQDQRLARQVKRCQALPGQVLFQYIDEEGQRHPIESSDVNAYLHDITGEALTAKDFRTWGGTVSMISALHALGPGTSKSEVEAKLVEAVKQTAEVLGNTPAVCRKYYIHPKVIEAYRDETLFDLITHTKARSKQSKHPLNKYEKVLSKLLEQ